MKNNTKFLTKPSNNKKAEILKTQNKKLQFSKNNKMKKDSKKVIKKYDSKDNNHIAAVKEELKQKF